MVCWIYSVVGFRSTASRNNTTVRPERAIRNPRGGSALPYGEPAVGKVDVPEVSIDCVPLSFRLPDAAKPAIMGKRQVHP